MQGGHRLRRGVAHLPVLALSLVMATEGRAEALFVGAAAQPLRLENDAALVGVPLAGYGGRKGMPDVLGQHPYAHYFPPGREARSGEEVRAKALVIKRGGQKLAFVSLDMVGVDRAFRDLVVEKLATQAQPFDEKAVILSATHTHSGPGALTGNHFLEFTATDRLHPLLREAIASQVAALVEQADSQAQEAELFHFTKEVECDAETDFATDANCLHKNRSREKHHGDHRLSFLAARATGPDAVWIGAMLNFAVHGTAYREQNDQLSADYPGVFERAFAKAMWADDALDPTSLPVLFLNGAEGDMTPNRPATMKADLNDFAAKAWQEWWSTAPEPLAIDEPWQIEAPEVALGRPFLYLRSKLKPLHDTFPFSLLGIELQTYFPDKARIWSFSLGRIRFLSVPGEPTTDVGLALRAVAAGFGFESAWILGLTNDHLGYFTSRADWALAEYESRMAAYGAFGARRLVNQHHCILEDL